MISVRPGSTPHPKMTNVPAFRRPTNLVFQQLSLFPHMSVFKNIGFGLEMKRISKPFFLHSVLRPKPRMLVSE